MSVGVTLGADGTIPASGRQGKTGEACVTLTHGEYYEPSSRGLLYAACDQGAGVTVQVTITTTATLSLHNPAGTGKRLAIKLVSLAYFNGTLGAGAWYHGFLPPGNTLPSSGTTLTSNCTDIGLAAAPAAVGVCKVGATVVAGTALYAFGSSLPILASTANSPFLFEGAVKGIIILEPGAQYQLLGVFGGTGSSPKISPSIVWEEVPIV